MLVCTECGCSKSLSDFYESNRARCKDCVKAAARRNRLKNLDRVRAYDRSRAKLPHRVEARRVYQSSDAFKASRADVTARYRNKHPLRNAANASVARALREGVLDRLPCQVCGRRAEAHHPDYTNFLGVVWLCVDHHAQLHADHRENLRESAGLAK